MDTPTRLAPYTCPQCGYKMDAASCVFEQGRPCSGDISVCLKCGGFAFFTETMQLRQMSTHEFVKLPPETRADLVKVRKALKQAKSEGGSWC